MILPTNDRETARRLIREKESSPFSAFDTATRAHRHADLGRHDEAALLFCLAAERADAEFHADPTKPNQAMNHVVRAGIAFDRAGDAAAAEPLLRQAIAFDWAGEGLPNDIHMVEWAFFHLLMNARSEPGRFAQLFDEAVARCAAIERRYTVIHPHQEELLRIALGMRHRAIAERLAGMISERRPSKKPVKALLAEARALLSE